MQYVHIVALIAAAFIHVHACTSHLSPNGGSEILHFECSDAIEYAMKNVRFLPGTTTCGMHTHRTYMYTGT